MSDVVTTDTTVWWDVDQTVADALAVLRLSDDDVDADTIRAFVPEVGQPHQPVPRPAEHHRVVPDTWVQELTKPDDPPVPAKDSPPATADDFGLSPGYVPADPMQPSGADARPVPRRWGVA